MIQKALSYPELQPLTDSDVRVAYTCKLIRRSIVNYAAFEAYFQSNKDSASVWSAITPLDWILAAEMEAATLHIANLALVESQSESLVSSYMVVFRRLAEKRRKRPSTPAVSTTQGKSIGTYLEKKVPLNQDFSSQNSSAFSQETSPFSSPASTGWDDEEDLLFGAPIRTNQTREEVKEQEVDARADRVLTEWLELEPDWLDVADCQNPSKSREELRKEMCISNDKGSYWSLLGLYRHVDVLRWFRDEGEDRFPSIVLLARIHLGKVSSSAFQERVFSSGGIVMGPLRTRTDHRRAEKQLLLRHNRNELLKLKQDAKKAKEQKET
ncbi:hypothetical protein F443_14032 [Phytophthora nicotianae P1569]|uniref:HAT C-terminal dimerisation domain-containing protein n=1 Tax=Phytophthora nicotianae P1569 TaxID=1317065 RepID=V9EQ85_PHYNI|nr:hypothetical protein F443_14032 [Phytophthora nicotianae P1569]